MGRGVFSMPDEPYSCTMLVNFPFYGDDPAPKHEQWWSNLAALIKEVAPSSMYKVDEYFQGLGDTLNIILANEVIQVGCADCEVMGAVVVMARTDRYGAAKHPYLALKHVDNLYRKLKVALYEAGYELSFRTGGYTTRLATEEEIYQ